MSKQIYIASSWKNQHAVELLTHRLREQGHTVMSFVENNHGEQKGHAATDENGKPIPIEEWIASERGRASFVFDTDGARLSDLVIYIGPSGTDAWAEVGIAWSNGVMIYGLWAKGEQAGLMRRLVSRWFDNYRDLLEATSKL